MYMYMQNVHAIKVNQNLSLPKTVHMNTRSAFVFSLVVSSETNFLFHVYFMKSCTGFNKRPNKYEESICIF